jgi:cyclase
MAALLRAGADKISMNSSAVREPKLIRGGADLFGSQCIVASIDASREGESWTAYTHGGRTATGLDAIEWATECADLGAGEILLTSMDRDGVRTGYDLDLTRTVAERVGVPVIASGGAGGAEHIFDALTEGQASAALLAGILHDGLTTVGAIKSQLTAKGLGVR